MIHDSHQKHAIGYALLHFTNTIVTHKPLQITRHIVTQQNFSGTRKPSYWRSWLQTNTDWLRKCGSELRESSEGKMAMISVGNYSQKRGKYHGRQWILFDLIGTKPYNNMLCITWPNLGGELSVVA